MRLRRGLWPVGHKAGKCGLLVSCVVGVSREFCRFRVELADSEDPRLESLWQVFKIWAFAGWALVCG